MNQIKCSLILWNVHGFILAVPGYGKSKNETLGPVSNEEFMAAVVSLLQIKPVIISPSMSGGFALPYLFEDPLQSTEKALGYIPVAPVLTANWEQNYPKSQVRSFAIVQMWKNVFVKENSDGTWKREYV